MNDCSTKFLLPIQSCLPLLTLAFALLVSGCLSNRGSDPVRIRRLAKGTQSGVIESRQLVIRDKPSWEKLWSDHQSGIQPSQPQPEIDFSLEMVIFVALGQQFSGGVSVEIDHVEKTSTELKAFVRRQIPPSGGMVTQALTSPFDIVAVPKSNLPSKFIEPTRRDVNAR